MALKRVAATIEGDLARSASGRSGKSRVSMTGRALRIGVTPAFAATMFAHSTANTLLAHSAAATLEVTAPAHTGHTDQTARDLAYRLALEQEFRTLASLRHPHIISVLDYGFDSERTPFFTMELLDAAVPLLDAARGRPFEQKVSLLVQIAQALDYLHRCAVLHRDLKPANILASVTEGGLRAKVLDFGLAIARESVHKTRGDIAGTLGYLAPEVLLGDTPSEASDLYALGVVAFELLCERHLFADGEVGAVLKGDLPQLAELPGPPSLRELIARLLARHPIDRPRDAAWLAPALCTAAGLPTPVESITIRESFLQSARFVAREVELDQLTSALTTMLAGRGTSYLIGGESGVGKSRLLDEMRAQSLVRGALFLRGQAVNSGGVPYQLFHAVARSLCLYVELSELEAGVMKTLVPDLPALLGKAVPEAPQLEANAAQQRLLSTFVSVLGRLGRPAVIVLEDLHWAGPESFDLLRHLLRRLPNHPILLLASYRDDEKPDLPTDLPGVPIMRLGRLERTHIESLSASMLGEAGKRPELLDLLQRETEGNLSDTWLPPSL